jgi:hypothetical protein
MRILIVFGKNTESVKYAEATTQRYIHQFVVLKDLTTTATNLWNCRFSVATPTTWGTPIEFFSPEIKISVFISHSFIKQTRQFHKFVAVVVRSLRTTNWWIYRWVVASAYLTLSVFFPNTINIRMMHVKHRITRRTKYALHIPTNPDMNPIVLLF